LVKDALTMIELMATAVELQVEDAEIMEVTARRKGVLVVVCERYAACW
jgi:hypothetical protein